MQGKAIRILPILLMLALLQGTVLATFSDVPPDIYYADAVEWALKKGIALGTGENQFSPKDTCTRGQVVTFLWRAEGKPEPKTTANPFSDVNSKSPYYKAILWACENGITNGTSATEFNPNGICTRGQIVTFLWRSKGEPSSDGISTLTGNYPEGIYYKGAIAWADTLGLLGGSGTAFKPNAPCPRADVVTYLFRATDSGASSRSKAYTPDFDSWSENYNWNGTSKLQKENDILIIQNDVPNHARFAQVVRVKPHTEYRLSATVHVDGYQIGNERSGGATIGIMEPDFSATVGSNDYVTSPEWVESWIVFDTGDRDSVALYASNGGYAATTSGNAYIKDIVLEELETDNRWNVLALIYKNVDTGTFKSSFSEDDIKAIQETLRKFPEDVRGLSNSRMLIGKMDCTLIDEPIRTLSNKNAEPTRGPGQDIDFDNLLEGEDYNQIVIYAPVSGANKTDVRWGGLGGTFYTYHGKPIWVCTINYIEHRNIFQTYTRDGHSADPRNLPWLLHEVLHCVESNSRARGIVEFDEVHSRMDRQHSSYTAGYSEQPYSWLDWYSDFMQDTVTGGRGLKPDSFLVSHLPEKR